MQVQRSDNARYVITLKGVEAAESILDRKTVPLLASASRSRLKPGRLKACPQLGR